MNPPDIPITHDLTSKQRKYANYRSKGMSKEEAKTLAGYAHTTDPETIERSPNLRLRLLESMEAAGISDSLIAKRLKQGLTTKKKVFFSKDGIVTDERTVPDSDIQHKHLRDILEIRGDIKQSTVENLNLGLIMIPEKQNEEDWNKPITDDLSTQKPIDASQ